jgi:hypothetical protein
VFEKVRLIFCGPQLSQKSKLNGELCHESPAEIPNKSSGV